MFKEEEDQLATFKEKYRDIPVPAHIDHYIKAGTDQASKKKKRNFRAVLSTAAIVAVLFLFVVSVRVSPAFASYAGQIPGLDRLVELIRGDKGLESAIKNDFVQVIGKSDTHEGITFTVDEIIADEAKMIIFYTLEADQDYNYLMLGDLEITDENGQSMAAAISYGSPSDEQEQKRIVSEKIEVDFGHDENLPEQIHMSVDVDVGNAPHLPDNTTWDVSFTIDHEKFANHKEVFPINETVSVEGQKMTFKEIIVYPTKIAILVKYNEQNRKELFAFDDLAIVNEKGEEWASINGVSGMGYNENEEFIFLQSNFFEQPEELYLQFSSIRALDKDQLDVVVDVEQERLLKTPDDQIKLLEVSKRGSRVDLKFVIKRSEKYQDDVFYQTFAHQYYDEAGNEYETLDGFGFRTSDDESEYISYLTVRKPEVSNNIILKISDYQTRIEKDVKIKVK